VWPPRLPPTLAVCCIESVNRGGGEGEKGKCPRCELRGSVEDFSEALGCFVHVVGSKDFLSGIAFGVELCRDGGRCHK
jgi:hypothetical protein